MDTVFTGVDGHIRDASIGGSGVDGGWSIDDEHWQRHRRKDTDRRKQVVELEKLKLNKTLGTNVHQ